MTAQITRALLCFMMLLTGLSAAEAACPDVAERQGSAEQLLVDSLETSSVVAHLAMFEVESAIVSLNIDGISKWLPPYPIAEVSFTRSSPLSRNDTALE